MQCCLPCVYLTLSHRVLLIFPGKSTYLTTGGHDDKKTTNSLASSSESNPLLHPDRLKYSTNAAVSVNTCTGHDENCIH